MRRRLGGASGHTLQAWCPETMQGGEKPFGVSGDRPGVKSSGILSGEGVHTVSGKVDRLCGVVSIRGESQTPGPVFTETLPPFRGLRVSRVSPVSQRTLAWSLRTQRPAPQAGGQPLAAVAGPLPRSPRWDGLARALARHQAGSRRPPAACLWAAFFWKSGWCLQVPEKRLLGQQGNRVQLPVCSVEPGPH